MHGTSTCASLYTALFAQTPEQQASLFTTMQAQCPAGTRCSCGTCARGTQLGPHDGLWSRVACAPDNTCPAGCVGVLQGVQAQYGCCFRGLLEFLELQGLLAVAAPGLTADMALANINNVRGLPSVAPCCVSRDGASVLARELTPSRHHSVSCRIALPVASRWRPCAALTVSGARLLWFACCGSG